MTVVENKAKRVNDAFKDRVSKWQSENVNLDSLAPATVS